MNHLGTPAFTEVEMTQVVLPVSANTLGTVFGGQVVSWMDICTAVSAGRYSRSAVVTAAIDSVHFIEPIKQGYIVVLKSKVNAVYHSSMEVGVVVFAENPLTGERRKAVRAYFTFVALSENGSRKTLNPLRLESEEDKRRNREALARRERRLQDRKEELQHQKKN